jgi:hypothetical protein
MCFGLTQPSSGNCSLFENCHTALDFKSIYRVTINDSFVELVPHILYHHPVNGHHCSSDAFPELYSILIEFGVPMKLVRLIKMCLNETYIKVHIDKYLSDTFRIQNGLK